MRGSFDDRTHDDRRFLDAGPGALEMYVRAVSRCLDQVRGRPEGEIPLEWFIPVEWVRGQFGGVRLANRMVTQGIFGKVAGGYRFAWIAQHNTADAVRAQRKRERAKWDARMARRRQPDAAVHCLCGRELRDGQRVCDRCGPHAQPSPRRRQPPQAGHA